MPPPAPTGGRSSSLCALLNRSTPAAGGCLCQRPSDPKGPTAFGPSRDLSARRTMAPMGKPHGAVLSCAKIAHSNPHVRTTAHYAPLRPFGDRRRRCVRDHLFGIAGRRVQRVAVSTRGHVGCVRRVDSGRRGRHAGCCGLDGHAYRPSPLAACSKRRTSASSRRSEGCRSAIATEPAHGLYGPGSRHR